MKKDHFLNFYNSRGGGHPLADKILSTDKALGIPKSLGCGVIISNLHFYLQACSSVFYGGQPGQQKQI